MEPPVVTFLHLFDFCKKKSRMMLIFITVCCKFMAIMSWVTMLWEIVIQMCMEKNEKYVFQLWLTNWFKRLNKLYVKKTVLKCFSFQRVSFRFIETICMELLLANWIFISTVQGGVPKQSTDNKKKKEWVQLWFFWISIMKVGMTIWTELWLGMRRELGL